MVKSKQETSTESVLASNDKFDLEVSQIYVYQDTPDDLRARTKVDFTVLPLLFLGLFVFQLDRMNLASALTGGLTAALGIDQATVNLGNQMLFLGIVVLEIPSNMLLQRIGPRIYIASQVLVFGFIATMQVFVQNRNGFLITRSFLGLAEAGYIPGAIYTLSKWYTPKELAKRVAIFFFGMFGGNALSPLLASGILKLDGRQGIAGWQWIFLIEGVFTMSVAILILCFLPDSPKNPKPLFLSGAIKISEHDGKLLQHRLSAALSDVELEYQTSHITFRKVWQTVCHWQRWPTFLATSLVFSTWSPLTTYTPSIIMSLGFDRTSANALSSVGGILALVVVFFFAWLSDRTNHRGLVVAIAITCYLITLVVARTVQPSVGKWSRWGLWTAVNAFAVGYHPVHNTWLQLNCADPLERSISIAMWVMFAIGGLMYGTQYYQGADSPQYDHGLEIQSGVVAAGLALVGVQELVYYLQNKKVVEYNRNEPDETKYKRPYVM